MTGTVTWAAMDVHARSTQAASLDVQTGELSRRRFDTGAVEPVVEWLAGLPGPVHACYEAGPTGYGLYRAAGRQGVRCVVIRADARPRARAGTRSRTTACHGLTACRTALDQRLSLVARENEFWPVVSRLRAFRGIDTLSALVLALEVGDFARFPRAVQLGSWLGLVPSRQQSGESDTHGPITKTGSRYARRILVEAAWHYLRPPRIGVTLASRHEGLPDHVVQIAWRAQHRLYRSIGRAHKKSPNVVNVAVARELACFIWGAATAA